MWWHNLLFAMGQRIVVRFRMHLIPLRSVLSCGALSPNSLIQTTMTCAIFNYFWMVCSVVVSFSLPMCCFILFRLWEKSVFFCNNVIKFPAVMCVCVDTYHYETGHSQQALMIAIYLRSSFVDSTGVWCGVCLTTYPLLLLLLWIFSSSFLSPALFWSPFFIFPILFSYCYLLRGEGDFFFLLQ